MYNVGKETRAENDQLDDDQTAALRTLALLKAESITSSLTQQDKDILRHNVSTRMKDKLQGFIYDFLSFLDAIIVSSLLIV
jgi:hypothetical protein